METSLFPLQNQSQSHLHALAQVGPGPDPHHTHQSVQIVQLSAPASSNENRTHQPNLCDHSRSASSHYLILVQRRYKLPERMHRFSKTQTLNSQNGALDSSMTYHLWPITSRSKRIITAYPPETNEYSPSQVNTPVLLYTEVLAFLAVTQTTRLCQTMRKPFNLCRTSESKSLP